MGTDPTNRTFGPDIQIEVPHQLRVASLGGGLASPPDAEKGIQADRRKDRQDASVGLLPDLLGSDVTSFLPSVWDRFPCGGGLRQWGIFPRLAYDTFKDKEDNWKVSGVGVIVRVRVGLGLR